MECSSIALDLMGAKGYSLAKIWSQATISFSKE
jgi:hypothetical protein